MRFTNRSLTVLALLLLTSAGALAQIPRTISFQGVLADAGGVLLPDNTYTLTLSIYSQATGGTAIFSESQPVQVVRGVFNAIIGATSPTGIPAGIDFNSQYWLGVQVNNGAELAPRTAFTSVPYALNAAVAQIAVHAINADTASLAINAQRATVADTAVAVRGGHVASVNGQQGAIEILGAGSTTITRNGNQFIVRSTDTSGGGIRRIDNFDGSLVIDPPQGPYVNMFIRSEGIQTYHLRDLSVTTEKINNQAVTNAKLGPNSVTSDKIMDGQVLTQDIGLNQVIASRIGTEGATYGFALMSNGTATPIWADPILMNIPYSATVNSADTLWSMNNTGSGPAGGFNIMNAASTSSALIGSTTGQGSAIRGERTATTGTTAAIYGTTNSTDASAQAVTGVVAPTAPGGFSSGIRGINNGTGGLGIGVWGSQAGSGWGVYGQTPSGIGVHGGSTTGFGVYGLSSSGIGVYGTSTTGTAGSFEIFNTPSTSNALSALTYGTGNAGRFEINNTASGTTALYSTTNGTGWAIHGRRGASNIITAPGAILGENSTGAGVVGFSASGTGVLAASQTSDALVAIGFGTGVAAMNAQAIGTNAVGLRASSSTGSAAQFTNTSFNTADAVSITNSGSGRGLVVDNTNAANAVSAIRATSNGSGTTLHALNTGTGTAAQLEISNASNTSSAARVLTNGIGNGLQVQLTNAGSGGRGVDVSVAGVGTGVFATSAGGTGVWGITSSISAAGVIGDNTFGEAVVGRNRGGNGVGAVVGRNDSSGYGVRGFNTKNGIGVLGQAGISGGTGVGGRFENVNAANTSTTLEVATNGIGSGISVQLTNASNGARGIDVMQAGVGPGVFATSAGGNALWGITSSISAAGVIGDNTFGEAVVGRNRGGNGVGAVVGRNDSSGYGVRGFNTKDGIGVLGQAGISGGTGVGGRFENVNAANGNDALQAATNGTGWAGNFTNANNSSASRGVRISTTAGQGGNALTVANGTVALSAEGNYASNTIVDDAVLVINVPGPAVIPTGPPLVNGATVWVVNNAGAVVTILNTTVGAFNINPGLAKQFLFVASVSGANWVPVQ